MLCTVLRKMPPLSGELPNFCAVHDKRRSALTSRFSDADRPVDYFGEQLRAAGYNYHGNEPMYSGITGEEFKADIYIGLVYYQRLRHMVNDKFQVRTTGPVDPLTRQPVKVGDKTRTMQ